MSINYKVLIFQQFIIAIIVRGSYVVPDVIFTNLNKTKSEAKPKIEVCINDTDRLGRIRLNCNASWSSLAVNPVRLKKGLEVEIYDKNIKLEGILDYYYLKEDKEKENKVWVVEVKENYNAAQS